MHLADALTIDSKDSPKTHSKSLKAPSVPKLDLCDIELSFGHVNINALVDTGSSFSIMSSDNFEFLLSNTKSIVLVQETGLSAISASGNPVTFLKKVLVHFKIGHLSWDFNFQVAKCLPVPIIIGSDFLTKTRAIINMANHTLAFPYGTPKIFLLQPTPQAPFNDSIGMGENLTDSQRQEVRDLISQFPETITKALGRTNLVNYHIRVNSDKVIRSRPYQYSPPKMTQMREHIDDLLKKGVITPSSSQYASPAFLVPKKGGKTRMVVDYRGINSIIDLEATPMPTIESAFQHLGQAKWFSLLDLNQAYNQIPLDEESKKFTAFVTPWAQYQFQYLPFGLASGSMVLTSLIDKIFGDIKFKYVYSFFDDLCVYSDGSFDDHIKKVRNVIGRLKEAGLTVNPEKITIAANHIQFLGHTFKNQSVSIHPERTQPIDQFPVPKNIKQLSRFLGMTAFYARFIKDFAKISQPLNLLKRKNVKFVWGPEQQESFDKLKAALTASPVLRMPDFNKRFVVHCDGSGSAVGAVLSQESDGQLLPVCYASRALNKHELNYSTLEIECLAVVFAFQKFMAYLEHRDFDLLSDCSALTWLLNHPRQAGRIARWIAFINNFKFTIQHIKGKDNVVADCLSRLFENTQTTQVPLSTNTDPPAPVLSLFGIPEAFKNIAQHQLEDPELAKLIKSPNKSPNFSVQQGVLLHKLPNQNKPRVVVPKKLFDMLFSYYHESPAAAHLGINKTLNKINMHFWAEDLRRVIADRVKSCPKCQRCKQAPNTRLGNLSSEVITKPWEKVFIDHIGPLPKSTKGNKYILTVVDSFSKFVLLLPTRNTKAKTTINLLSTRVFSIFGPPKQLVSDNVSHFRSRDMQEFCIEMGITHVFTTPYYPNPSHAERVNKNVKVAIRTYHSQYQTHWDEHLHWFQIAFNSAVHESTKSSPDKLFLGRNLHNPLELHWNLDELTKADTPDQSLQQEWARAVANLRRAREVRQQRYDSNRVPAPFRTGDWVMYRLNPISSAADHINHKLLPLWSEPCVIESFSSPVTVRLVNPVNGKLVRKAHVSQLKRFFMPQF